MDDVEKKYSDWLRIFRAFHEHRKTLDSYLIGDETNGYRFDIFQYYGRIGLYVGNFFNEEDTTKPTIIDF